MQWETHSMEFGFGYLDDNKFFLPFRDRNMKRKVVTISIVVLVAYIVGTLGVRGIQVARTPDWKWALGKPEPIIFPQDTAFSPQHQIEHNYMKVDILHAEQWGEQEVQTLLRYIDIPPVPDSIWSGPDEQLILMAFKRNTALSIIMSRIAAGAPIEEDQRQILIDRLTEGMYQTESIKNRTASIANVLHSGLADTPGPIRDRVFLFYNNPGEYKDQRGISEANNIKRQLTARGTFEIEGDN